MKARRSSDVNPRRQTSLRRYLKSVLVAGCAAAFFTAMPAPSGAEEPWQHLNEAAIRSALSGAELSDGQRHRYRFLPDGTFSVTDSAGRSQGRWRLERDELCMTRENPQPSDECFEVQQRGAALRLLQDGYVIMQGKLSTERRFADRPRKR